MRRVTLVFENYIICVFSKIPQFTIQTDSQTLVLFLFTNEYPTNKLSEGHRHSHANAGDGDVEGDSGGLDLG